MCVSSNTTNAQPLRDNVGKITCLGNIFFFYPRVNSFKVSVSIVQGIKLLPNKGTLHDLSKETSSLFLSKRNEKLERTWKPGPNTTPYNEHTIEATTINELKQWNYHLKIVKRCNHQGSLVTL